MHRRSQEDAVSFFHELNPLVHRIIGLNALFIFLFRSLATGKASPDGLVTNMNDLGSDALFFQDIGHHPQSMPGVSLFIGASVECNNLHHGLFSFACNDVFPFVSHPENFRLYCAIGAWASITDFLHRWRENLKP